MTIGPSGVRALPLAAGRNVGGHYFRYFSFLLFSFLIPEEATENAVQAEPIQFSCD